MITLPEDLREMDENQFIEVFNLLKEKTKNWKEFSPELLIENNQFLLIIRCCLNLSQKEFSKKLGSCRDWVRRTEAGRNKIIHLKPASRWSTKIEELMINSQITLKKAQKFWKKFEFARDQKFTEVEKKMKPISKLSEEELKERFKKIKRDTNNFTMFNNKIFINNPQNILIFRLVLGFDHKEFARQLCKSPRSVRAWEHLELRMKKKTIQEIIEKIRILFEKHKPKTNFETVLNNFRIFTNFFGHRNIEAWRKNGLKSWMSKNFTELEKQIIKILNRSGCNKFGVHSIVSGLKKDFNVDFVIGKRSSPIFVVEAFTFNKNSKRFRNCHNKVIIIDHRFQMIKLKHPKVKTILCIEFIGKPILKDIIQEMIKSEIVNTDFILINDEINELPYIIKRNI